MHDLDLIFFKMRCFGPGSKKVQMAGYMTNLLKMRTKEMKNERNLGTVLEFGCAT